MATEATVLVASVEKKSGEKNGKPWTRYALKDGNESIYSTFDGTLGEVALGFEGKQAIIEYRENGKFKDLLSVKPAPVEENGQVNPGDGSYIRGKTNPEDQLWITARFAVEQARAALVKDVDDTAKDHAVKVGILAHAFFNSVLKLRHLEHAQNEPVRDKSDDDIPF